MCTALVKGEKYQTEKRVYYTDGPDIGYAYIVYSLDEIVGGENWEEIENAKKKKTNGAAESRKNNNNNLRAGTTGKSVYEIASGHKLRVGVCIYVSFIKTRWSFFFRPKKKYENRAA